MKALKTAFVGVHLVLHHAIAEAVVEVQELRFCGAIRLESSDATVIAAIKRHLQASMGLPSQPFRSRVQIFDKPRSELAC